MKKHFHFVLLTVFALILGGCLLGCQNPTADDPAVTPTETPTEAPTATPEVTPTPTSVIAEDARPVIVQTAYPTEDVVIADYVVTDAKYNADPTGEKDATAAIQSAIDACSGAGGGTVFIPTGTYLVKRKISVPAGVTLRGDWEDPDSTARPGYGTVILANLNTIKEGASCNAGNLFYLNTNSAVIGLTVFYPRQNAAEPLYYGYTFYCGSADTVTLRNLTIINGCRGIGVSANPESEWHELAEISHIRMCVLETGFEMYHSSDVGYTTDVRISTDYWTKAAGDFVCAAPDALVALCRKQTVGMLLGDLDLEMLSGITVEGCQTGLRFINPGGSRSAAFWGTFYDLHITDCDYGVDVLAINTHDSALFAKGEIEGSVCAVRNAQPGVPLKLCGITVRGETEGTIQYGDDAVTETGGISGLSIYRGTTVKPASNLYVADIQSFAGKKEDAAPRLQELLNEAGKTGGVVYVPAGIYSLYTPLTVPAGVELAGIAAGMTKDTGGYNGGTLFLSYVSDTATITLGENAGVTGLRIWCPANDPTTGLEKILAEDAGTAVPIIRGAGNGVYCTDTVLVAGFVGIDFRGCDNHLVRQVFGCCYLHLIKAGGKNGSVEECLANPHFTQRHCNLFRYFDTDFADLKRWAKHHDGEQQQSSQADYSAGFVLLCDTLLREHCVPYAVEDAENQHISNVFMYASYHLLTVKNSTVTALNVAIDTLKGTNAMFVAENSNLLVVNAMRIFGISVSPDSNSTVHIYNRVGYNELRERSYNSDLSFEDKGDSPADNITDTMMLSACDKIEKGVTRMSLTMADEQVKEGIGAWFHRANKNETVIFEWNLQETLDISDYTEDGYIHLWIYVSNPEAVGNGNGQLELCSGGGCDVEEWGYPLFQNVKNVGWNELYIYLPGATETGGTFDPTRLNYIRLYSLADCGDVIIDDMYFCR